MIYRRILARAFISIAGTLFFAFPAFSQQDTGDIIVAQIGPFTGLPAGDAQWLNEGFTAAFNEVNVKGGVQGRRIRLLQRDDGYTFEGFKRALNELMPSKPVALLSPVGSATMQGVLNEGLLDKSDTLILNVVPGANAFRKPGHPNLFHIRESDGRQVHRVIAHAATMNIKSMGVLYQDIPIGASGLRSSREAITQQKLDLDLIDIETANEPKALAEAAKKMATQSPQVALVIGNPKFMGDGVAALRKAGMKQPIFALSYLPPSVLHKLIGEKSRGVGIVQTFPNPMGTAIPLQRSFRAAMRAAHPDIEAYTPFHIEGYITARVFIEAAQRAKSISPAHIAESLRRVGPIDLGGYRVNFAASNEGGTWLDIGVVSFDGKLIY